MHSLPSSSPPPLHPARLPQSTRPTSSLPVHPLQEWRVRAQYVGCNVCEWMGAGRESRRELFGCLQAGDWPKPKRTESVVGILSLQEPLGGCAHGELSCGKRPRLILQKGLAAAGRHSSGSLDLHHSRVFCRQAGILQGLGPAERSGIRQGLGPAPATEGSRHFNGQSMLTTGHNTVPP